MFRKISLLTPPILFLAACASEMEPEELAAHPDRPPVAVSDRTAANLADENVRPAQGEADAIVTHAGDRVGVIDNGGMERTKELGAERD